MLQAYIPLLQALVQDKTDGRHTQPSRLPHLVIRHLSGQVIEFIPHTENPRSLNQSLLHTHSRFRPTCYIGVVFRPAQPVLQASIAERACFEREKELILAQALINSCITAHQSYSKGAQTCDPFRSLVEALGTRMPVDSCDRETTISNRKGSRQVDRDLPGTPTTGLPRRFYQRLS